MTRCSPCYRPPPPPLPAVKQASAHPPCPYQAITASGRGFAICDALRLSHAIPDLRQPPLLPVLPVPR